MGAIIERTIEWRRVAWSVGTDEGWTDVSSSDVLAADVLAEASGLVKRFGSFTAVDGIDFEVRRGEAFGFLGPNGAGKTSAMRMLGCTSPVSAGRLHVFGLDPATEGPAIRARQANLKCPDAGESSIMPSRIKGSIQTSACPVAQNPPKNKQNPEN